MQHVARLRFATCILAGWLGAGCGLGSTPARDVRVAPRTAAGGTHTGAAINQFQMQDEVQRFTNEFISNIASAMDPLTNREQNPDLRWNALTRLLLYSTSALEIASGPMPEVNALDMVVFISLSRSSLERYWVPQVLGEPGVPLIAAFRESEKEAWALVAKVLTPEQQALLASMIKKWIEDNPDNIRVELVRFREFSEISGRVSAEQRKQAQGLFGSVAAATQTADQALMLTERAMFLGNRMPYLLRIQMRLGAHEVIDDSLERVVPNVLGRIPEVLEQIPDPRPVLDDLLVLTTESRQTLEELRLVVDGVRPLVESGKLEEALEGTTRLTADARELLREVRELEPQRAEEALLTLETRANRFAQRLLIQIGVLGAALILLFWTGYYVVKRLKPSERSAPGNHPRFPRPRPSHP